MRLFVHLHALFGRLYSVTRRRAGTQAAGDGHLVGERIVLVVPQQKCVLVSRPI